MADDPRMAADLDFESLVNRYYRALYQFAFSLTRTESEASDLTQQTFYIWATKGHQLRDASKAKTWLFTTLHREFLKTRRRQDRFPHVELEKVANEVPSVSPAMVNQYELRKFNLSDTVTLSRSVTQVIWSLERMGKDARHARLRNRVVDEAASVLIERRLNADCY